MRFGRTVMAPPTDVFMHVNLPTGMTRNSRTLESDWLSRKRGRCEVWQICENHFTKRSDTAPAIMPRRQVCLDLPETHAAGDQLT